MSDDRRSKSMEEITQGHNLWSEIYNRSEDFPLIIFPRYAIRSRSRVEAIFWQPLHAMLDIYLHQKRNLSALSIRGMSDWTKGGICPNVSKLN